MDTETVDLPEARRILEAVLPTLTLMYPHLPARVVRRVVLESVLRELRGKNATVIPITGR